MTGFTRHVDGGDFCADATWGLWRNGSGRARSVGSELGGLVGFLLRHTNFGSLAKVLDRCQDPLDSCCEGQQLF